MIINSKQFNVVICKREQEFAGTKLFELDILGRKSIEWLEKLDENCKIVDSVDVKTLKDSIVLYSDTPLVNQNTLEQSITYMYELGIFNAELPCGYIITSGEGECKKIDVCSEDFVRLTDAKSYAKIISVMKDRINERFMENGVFMKDPNSVYIDDTVTIGRGVIIENNNVLKGNTVISDNVILDVNNELTDTEIGKGTKLTGVIATQAKVGENTSVGPYAYLRPGACVGSNCKVGDFVEIKNSNIADGTKVPHLAYVGDADVGSRVNVGCGVIFANYDGKKKHRTKVGDNTFLGSNTTLIAPVEIGNQVFIAAGSTVAHSIDDNDLVIARARETIKEGRAEKYLKKD